MDDSQSRRPNRRLYIHRDQIGDWNHRPRYECQKRNANIAVGRRLPRRESLQRLRLGRRRQHLRLRVARRRGCWFLFFIFRATRDPSPAAWRARRVAPRTRCVARARAPPRRARSPAHLSLLRDTQREGKERKKPSAGASRKVVRVDLPPNSGIDLHFVVDLDSRSFQVSDLDDRSFQ